MPRGRGQGRGRGRRGRGRSSDRGAGARRGAGAGKAWTDRAELLAPHADPQPSPMSPKFDATRTPSTAVAQRRTGQPVVLRLSPSDEECSQDSALLTASWSAVVKCHLKADIGQLVQNEGGHPHSAADSERAKVHFSFDTKLLTTNIRRPSTGGEPSAYKPAPPSPESLSEASAQYFENNESHSVGELESRSSDSNPDTDERSQTVSERRAQSAGAHRWVTDPEKKDKPIFSDHNANFLSHFKSGPNVEVLQSADESSVGDVAPSSKQQCFHSTVSPVSYNETAVDGNSSSASVYCSKEASISEDESVCTSRRISEPTSTSWEFAPPLELPQTWPVPFDTPTKQNIEFITRPGSDTLSLGDQCSEQCAKLTSRQPEFTLPLRNTSSLFSHCSVSKWRLKPPQKMCLSKLRRVKTENARLKRIQKDECSGVLLDLDEVFSVFCSRCRRPGRTYARNQNKIIKKRCHWKYWYNLHILRSQIFSKISDENREIKCCSCHKPFWKCHKNKDIFEITPNSHVPLGSNCSTNGTEEITGIRESETEDAVSITTNKVQNQLSRFSHGEFSYIPNTAAEDEVSKIATNLQHLNQNSDPTHKFKLQNVTLVVCMADERDTETIVESQRVQVPCQTGQEFMEMSNKSNPYPYKISGIFGSENGFSACLEDKGDLSNEYDFDINNSGELTLPSYEAQLVVSKDKAEALNFSENSVFLTVMCKHSSCAEAISHLDHTAEMTACNSENDPTVEIPQPFENAGEQFNSVENTHHGSNETPFEEMSSNRNETAGHKNGYIRTKETKALHDETDYPVVIPQPTGNTGRQLTSIENMRSGSNWASTEEISSNMNETVVHKKNYNKTVGITRDLETDMLVTMPQTVDNMGEHLNSTENTQSEGTDAQLGGVSSVMMEIVDHNERSEIGSIYNENAGQSSTMNDFKETECFVCIKEENEVALVGEYSKETLEMVNANLLQNTDLCSNHSTFREKITTCETIRVPSRNSITVKDEIVKDEEEDFGSDGTCYSVNCFMCAEEKKQMHQMSVIINTGPVVVAKSFPTVGSEERLVGQSGQTDVSPAGCSSDTDCGINSSSGEADTLLVESSNSIANSFDLSISDNEELNEVFNPRRSPRNTAEQETERNEDRSLTITEPVTGRRTVSVIVELEESVSSHDLICGDNNNCIEEQVAERLNSLSSNSTETFDSVANEHEADGVEDELRNLFSGDSCTSEIQINDVVGSVMLVERSTEYRLCIQEELSELNVPHGKDKQPGIAHEDGFQQNCDISSTNESQNCAGIKDEVRNLTTGSTEYSHNAENERNDGMTPEMPHEQDAEYALCNFQEELGSVSSAIIEHEDGYQQSYDTSSTNEGHINVIIKYESSSDEEYGSCFSDCETDSDSDASVQIIAEIRRSENLDNQSDGRPLHTSPLSSIGSEDIGEFVSSQCSSVLSTTEFKYPESFLTNQADGRSPLSSFNAKETCNSVDDSGCISMLDSTTIRHAEGTSNNQPVDSQLFEYLQNSLKSEETFESLDFTCMSTLARTLDNSVDYDNTSTEETEMEQTGVPVVLVSIPVSSITDPGLLERLVSERNRRKADHHTGPPHIQTPEGATLENSSDVQYSAASKRKRKAINRDETRGMNGRGKRTFEKVAQAKEVGDQSPVVDLPSRRGSEKQHENDDARARDVIESSSSATTKYRDTLGNNEKQNAEELCKRKNAHQAPVLSQYEDGSDEEGKLMICEESLEGNENENEEEEEEEAEESSGKRHTVLSCEDISEENRQTSVHDFESNKLIKAQDIEGSNLTAQQKGDVLESSQYSCENQAAPLECQAVSSLSDRHETHCKRKLFTDARDESQMTVLSNVTCKESLSPSQKLPEVKPSCSDVKGNEAMEHRYCDSSDAPVSLQSEKRVFDFDEGSSKLKSDGRIDAEDTPTPFMKISRKTVNEKDVHGKSSEEQETGDGHSSVCMNKVLIHTSSKSSTRRISSKARMKYVDLDSLPPSYQILRRDLNEVLEQENLCVASYSLPRKVPKKLTVPKVGGYRRPRECQKGQIINDAEESTSKKIRREEPDISNSEVSVEDQKKSSVQEETEYMADQKPHSTENLCQQNMDLTAKGNADGHQHHHQKKKKPAIVQPEEMEVCHDKPSMSEKESTVSTVSQLNLSTNNRKKCTVRLKRCDRFSWIQCANESTLVESGDLSTEKTPTSDECGETDSLPEKNVAAEPSPSQELDDQGGKSSVLSRHSKTEMENRTSVAKEQVGDHPKQLFTKKNPSQKIPEDDDKSLVSTGRKDHVNKLSAEEKEHHCPSPKPVEVTHETVRFHEHKAAIEVPHSQHKNKNGSNMCALEQSQQCLSQSPDEITIPENIINSPNQAIHCSSPSHHQSGQEDVAKENRGDKHQDHSVNSGMDEESSESNKSSYRVPASYSEDQVLQNFVERSESPHFERIGGQPQEAAVDCWQQESITELRERVTGLLSLMKKGECIEDIDMKVPYCETVTILTRLLEQMKEPQKIPHQSLQDKIQIEECVSGSESPPNVATEQSVPEQVSHEPKVEFQQHRQSPLKQPVSAPEETREQHVSQKQSQKSVTDFQDPVEKLPKPHICEADSQDVVLNQREPSKHEVEGSHTENDTVPPTQHTKLECQTHDTESQPHTSQSQQTVTTNQFLPQESLSCSERLKHYSKPTSTVQEETTRQQKADQRYVIQHSLKEKEPSQEKDVEPHNPQAQMLIQQQVQDQHRVMLNTIKHQKQQFSSVQQTAQQKEPKCHKEPQQSSLQQSVIQTQALVQQWHHIQQHTSQHHQTQCMDIDKVGPQQHNVYSGAPQAEKVPSIVQNPMGCHQALLQQHQQMQHLASLEQQPFRQLAAMPNQAEQPQQTMQQQMEWQQQRAAHHIPKPHTTVEHQTVPQNQQQAHPYQHRLYFPQMQQHYQLPHSTEVQLRPNYPHQYHSRFNSPPTWNSNSHVLRQVPCGPLDGQQLQPQQQQYPHFHHQQQLERWHSSRRPGTDIAATVPAVLASPSMSGGTVMESEHDRRRALSREAINSFDSGHRVGAVPSTSCPVTPANTENIHTTQVHPPQTYMRAGPHPQPNNTTVPVQAPLNTASIHQRSMKVVPSSNVDQDQRPPGHGGRLKIPTPPVVSAFVERVMKDYQPDVLNTEDTYRHLYKLPEREWAARFALPQDSVHTRHGTATVQLPYSQPAMMFPEHARIPASSTQPPLYKTVHAVGQSPHRTVVPAPSSCDDSVNNSPVNSLVNCAQPTPTSTNVNVQHLPASSSNRILQEASLSSVRDTENFNCDCNVIDLSQDKNTPEDNSKCQMIKWSDRTPKGTELHRPVMEKPDSASSSKAISDVPQASDHIQGNIPDNLQVNSYTTKTVHHSESLGEKCKSETLCGTPEKRLCQDPDNKARALPNMCTHQVTAMDLSPSTVVDCTTKSTPSQSSPHMLGASYPQSCATSRPSMESKQNAMHGGGASCVNCGKQNQELCTVSCCEQSRSATHTKGPAAAGSTCCGTTQQSQQSTTEER